MRFYVTKYTSLKWTFTRWSRSFSVIWSMFTSHPEARRRSPRAGPSSFDYVAAGSGPLILQRGADENRAAPPVGGGVSILPKAQQQGRLLARTVALLMAGMVCALASPVLCFAQVQLPTVNLGDTNFEDAFAGPGWLLQEFPEAYVASELKDSHGKTILGSNPVTGYSTTTHVAFISKKRVLGGWLVGEVLQPLVDLDVQLANGTSSRVRGLADLTVGTGLQWAPKKSGDGAFVHRVVLDVGLPTGKYSDRRSVNIGNHFVVVNPYYALTYERKQVEFSARLHYLWNSTNTDPYVGFGINDMQPGQAFHVNYAASYALRKNVRLGFNGYWLQQVTDHELDGTSLPDSRERTVGFGPGLQVSGRNLWLRLNGYMEANVRNRPSGFKVTLRLSKTLPTGEVPKQ